MISREGIKTINGKPLQSGIRSKVTEGERRPGDGGRVLRRYTGTYPLSRREGRISDTFISDERRWGEVWQMLCGDAERPDVDFKTELVIVAINNDENQISSVASLDGDGDLTVEYSVTLMVRQNPVLGTYAFSVISRQGIKSIQGRPLRSGIWRTTPRPELPLR